MNNQRDLLPWILGGLSVATVAVVITVASAGKTAPSQRPAGAATAQVTPAPDSLSLPVPATEAATPAVDVVPAVAAVPAVAETAPPPAAQPQATAEPALQTGQIWECMTNGVKTFSNNPCGEKSTLLEVRAINTMNPTPVVRYARANGPEPRYSPEDADQNNYSDQDVYGEQGPAETGVNSYAIVQGLAFLPRKRPEHPHRPFHHDPGHNPGHNPGHSPGHSPGSALRRN
jgi:hypothetical protein